MKWHRIYGIILRFFYIMRRSLDRQADMFYWPAVDLILWGLTSQYFASQISGVNVFVSMIVAALILWQIAWRSQAEITINILEDLWNKNLINIFVSPLMFSEWLSAFIILGVIKALITGTFATLFTILLYHFNIIHLGLSLIPFFLLLLMVGWWVGFTVAGLIMRFGTRLQNLAWSLIAVLTPFSAIYYPVSILPHWAQVVSRFVPTSYIFEGAREVLATGRLDPSKLLYSFTLNVIFLIGALLFLRASFRRRLEKGMQKLQEG